jgi:plastocyanin
VQNGRRFLAVGAAAIAALSVAPLAAAAAPAGTKANPIRARAVFDRGFLPGRVVVRPGARVFFRNVDRLEHTATAEKLIRGRPAFNSGRATTGAFTVIAPQRPGAYTYICVVHGFMQGVLVVRR